jgi:23S rRNA pseudouridine1911/1915/1917 synthase
MKTNFPDVIFEDDDYLVINKPAGLAVHGGGNIKEETLADLLIARYPKIIKVGDDEARPGIVHRLDKEVSGLMVVAKNNDSFASLKAQFQKRDINKQYLALAYGKIGSDDGEINFPIKRSSEGYKMAAMPLNAVDLLTRRSPKSRDTGNISGVFKAKEAITLFKVIKRFVNYTLLEVKIKTGRTHQIRVHFFALGHPLVGDNLYCTKKTKVKNEKIKLGRVFLMASQLSFTDLEGKKREFSLKLAPELEAFLPKF